MSNSSETHTAIALASWLDAIAVNGACASSLLLLMGFAAMLATAVLHGQLSMVIALAIFALHGLALWPLERVLCLRLAFDAKLFASIGAGQYGSLAELDDALARIGLRKSGVVNTSHLTRDFASRVDGTKRLVRAYVCTLSGQLLLVFAAVAFTVAILF